MIFTLRGRSNGWIGMGINAAPLMAGADLFVAFVNTSGAVQVSFIWMYFF
jgi:hypothetical protein